MKMFSPFTYGRNDADDPGAARAPSPATGSDDALNELKAQVEAMQKQIEKLASAKK